MEMDSRSHFLRRDQNANEQIRKRNEEEGKKSTRPIVNHNQLDTFQIVDDQTSSSE